MNLKTYKSKHSKKHLVDIAERVGSSYEYIWEQLPGGHSKASPDLANKLHVATNGRVGRRDIRPDIFGDIPKKPATDTTST